MPQLPSAFNAEEHEKMSDFSALPPGDYIATITDSEVKESKQNAENHYWKLTIEITGSADGGEEGKGKKVWVNLNLVNTNPQAVEIANKELATLTEACGLVNIESTEELHGIPFIMTLKKTPSNANYPEGNEPTGYKRIEGAVASSVPGAAAPSNPATANPAATTGEEPTKKKKPWE